MRFSLKASLLLLTVAAAGLMPLMLLVHRVRNQESAIRKLGDLGARVWYEEDRGFAGLFPKVELISFVEFRGDTQQLAPLAQVDVPHVAFVHANVDSPLIEILTQLRGLEKLNLSDTDVGDEALDRLARLRELKYINVMGSRVTPQGVLRFQRNRPDCHLSVAPDASFMLWLNRLFGS